MERKSIGSFIAALRRAKGMTQKELAEALMVSDKAVSRWERDDSLPDLTLLPVIADIFDITVDELLRGEKKRESGGEEARQDRGGDEARLKKQTKRAVRAALSKVRTHSIIVLGVGFLGIFLALLCNFGFERGLLGLVLGVLCMIAAGVLEAIWTVGAWDAMDQEEYDPSLVLTYRRTVICWCKRCGIALGEMLALCLPMLACLEGTFYGFVNVFVEASDYFVICIFTAVIMGALISLALYFINRSLIARDILEKSSKHSAHGVALGCLSAAVAITVLSLALNDASNYVHYITYDNFPEFQAALEKLAAEKIRLGQMNEYAGMGNASHVLDGDSVYYDEQGKEISLEEYVRTYYIRPVYDKDDNQIGEINDYGVAYWSYSPDRSGYRCYTEREYYDAVNKASNVQSRLLWLLLLEPVAAYGLWWVLSKMRGGSSMKK